MVNTVKISKAISDPIRFKIMLMLAQSKEGYCPIPGKEDQRPGLCNCEIMEELGLIQSRVSYHMKELIQAGLVTEEYRGKWRIYFINNKNLKEYIKQLEKYFALE